MKLLVKIEESEWAVGGHVLIVSDEQGNYLPNQANAELRCDAGEPATLIVTFHVDGDHVRLAK